MDRAARERKQKIFVAVGGLVLVLLMAIQLPKLLGGSESAATDTTGTDTVSTEPGAPATPTTPTTVAVALVDTDQPLPADPSKLRSLRSFSGKDPFVQQVKAPTPDAGGGSSETGGGGGGGEKSGESDSTGFSVGEQSKSVTVISVNGARQVLSPGSLFPAANPVFVLIGEQPKAKTVTIGVAGGEYASGAKATKLAVGKPLVLVNTTTDAKYRLVLVAVGDGSAPEPTKATSKQKKGTESP
jgi:ribosomal protein S9